MYGPKNVFDKSPYEDSDFIFNCSMNDLQFLKFAFDSMHLDHDEVKKIEKTIKMNMELFKEIYVHLQSKSKVHPWVDDYCFRQHFIRKSNVPQS